MLPPGRGTPREVAERNQRERLFAAMAATVARKGYEATAVADLVELCGVGRSGFYRLFSDREVCLVAAVEALVTPALKSLPGELEAGDRETAREAFEALMAWIAEQSAAAKMCLATYSAGPAAAELAEGTLARVEEAVGGLIDAGGADGGRMPAEIVRALLGGVLRVIHSRLYLEQEKELVELAPALWQWFFSYPPPPTPLQSSDAPSRRAQSFGVRQARADRPERITRALAAIVAEKGNPEVTVAEIVARCRMSQRTFYEFFPHAGACRVAAVAMISAKMVVATTPALRSEADWRERVRASQEAILTFWVHEPEYARFAGIEMYERGRRMLEQREPVSELFADLLAPGYELAPQTPTIATEAIGGTLEALVFEQVKARGTVGLLELVPACTYICLAPFLGGEEAYRIAVGGGKTVEGRI